MDNIKTSRNNNAECPICHSKLENSVCTSCGWVHIVFPEQVPQAIATFNAKRREVARKIHDQHGKSIEKNNEICRERDEAIKMASTYQSNANNAIAEVNNLKIELEDAKRKVTKPYGIVYVTDLQNDFQAVATINPGINTYGSDATEGLHHMIRLSPFSMQLLSKHFSVEPIGKHLLLKDLTGGSMNIPAPGIYVEGKTIKINKDIEVKFFKLL